MQVSRLHHSAPAVSRVAAGFSWNPKNIPTRPCSTCAVGSVVSDGLAPSIRASTYTLGPLSNLDSLDDDNYHYQPSADLRDLALAQLGMLHATLARFTRDGAQPRQLRTTVYARTASSLDRGGELQLLRIAAWPEAGQHRGHQQWDEGEEIVILSGARWGNSSSGTDCDVEASLVQEEVVLLPNSASLVFPLVEGDFLVGLLLAESPGDVHSSPAANAAAGTEAGSAADPGAADPADPAAAAGVLPCTDDEMWCLRGAVGPLSKACAMDLRSALARAQAAARQRLARSLLQEVRGPLKAMRTFTAMLAPRLEEGEPEGDMAAGMLTQQRRMHDVVAQLEAALHGKPAAPGRVLVPPAQGQPQLGDGSGGRSSSAWHAGAGWPALLSASAGAPALLASTSSSETCGDGGTSSSGGGGTTLASFNGADSDRSGGDCDDCRSAATAALSRSLSLKQATVAAARGPSSASGMPSSSTAASGVGRGGSGGGSGGTGAAAVLTSAPRAPADLRGAVDAAGSTIDIELDAWPAAAAAYKGRAVAAGRAGASRGTVGGLQGKLPGSCNVVEVLSELLPTAARLARMAGVELIALPPLRVVDEGGGGAGGREQGRAAAAAARARPPALLPRPARPLWIPAPARLVRRVLGYLLDLAIQSTARGGRVAVGASESGGGVEVALTLTGRLEPGRLHTASRGFADSLEGGGSAGGGGGGSGGGKGGALMSLEFAERLAQGAGGRVRVAYRRDALGPSGALESATSVQVWWPGPPAAPA